MDVHPQTKPRQDEEGRPEALPLFPIERSETERAEGWRDHKEEEDKESHHEGKECHRL